MTREMEPETSCGKPAMSILKQNVPPLRAFAEAVPEEYPPAIGELEFTGWQDEQLSWKTGCYIGDWSFVPEVRFKGPDAIKLFSDLSINSFANFPVGKAKHCVQCNEEGKVIAEGILMRLSEDEVEWNGGTPTWALYNIGKRGYRVAVEYPHTYKLQVSGPTALALLQKLTKQDLRDIRFMTSRTERVLDEDVALLRQGMAGEIGFELHGPIEARQKIYDAVVQAGQEFGIRRLGRRTLQTNHLEACYPTGGIHFVNALPLEGIDDYVKFIQSGMPEEVSSKPMFDRLFRGSTFMGSWEGQSNPGLNRSPVEMGWGKNIKFDHDFLGREALEAEIANPRRTVATLEYNSEDMVRIYASLFSAGDTYPLLEVPHSPYILCWADNVLKDGNVVGHATYPGYSYYFRKVLALSFIDVEDNEVGKQLDVLWGNPGGPQTIIRATVADAPYKKDTRRADLRAA